MKVYLVLMSSALGFEFIHRSVNICPGEWLSIGEQDVIFLSESLVESELKCEAEAISCTAMTHVRRDALPILRMNRDLAFLKLQELLIAQH